MFRECGRREDECNKKDIGPALVALQALNIRCVPMTNSLSLNIGVFPGPSLTCLGALGLLSVAGLGHGEDVGYAGLLPPAGLAPRLGHLLRHMIAVTACMTA